MKKLNSLYNSFFRFFGSKENREEQRSHYSGKRKIDFFRRNIIRYRKTKEIIDAIVSFLKDFLETENFGFYFWNEALGQFTDYINENQKTIQIFDPIILILSDYDLIFLKRNLDLIKNPEHKKHILNLFEEKNANVLIPLILNESVLGFIYANTKKYLSVSEYFTLEEFRYFAIIALSNSIIYNRLENLLKNLEEKIKERTEELEKTQKTLLQQEKMAILGTMISGIAHELNTPTGVISASSTSLIKYFEKLLETVFIKKDFRILSNPFFDVLNYFIYHLSLMDTNIIQKSYKLKDDLKNYFKTNQIQIDEKLIQFLIEFKLYSGNPKTFNNKNNLFHILIHYYTECNEEEKKISLETLELIALIYENISRISHSSKNISKLVQSLRTYSRSSKNEFVSTNLSNTIRDTLNLLANTLKSKIEIQMDLSYSSSIECDSTQIQQVFINLIMNSFQALMSSKSLNPTITIKTKELDEKMIEIQITDNGPGIPKEIQEQVWNPFFTTKAPGEGTGLGLGIVKNIVENHQGKIFFESSEKGTTFYIQLPKVQKIENRVQKKHPSLKYGRYDWR
ncbi:MAG: sensor histidine kinase [Leptonema sp. (in: bacteria)]